MFFEISSLNLFSWSIAGVFFCNFLQFSSGDPDFFYVFTFVNRSFQDFFGILPEYVRFAPGIFTRIFAAVFDKVFA